MNSSILIFYRKHDNDNGSGKIVMVLQLEIYSDLICPWCYIGKRRLEAALKLAEGQHTVRVTWHPFQLNPDMPRAGMDRRTYRTAKFGSWERSQELDAGVAAAGAEVGINFNYAAVLRTPNTFDSHRLVWLAGQHEIQDQIVQALFAAYFVQGLDLSQQNVLAETVVRAGLPRTDVEELLAGDRGAEDVRQLEQAARETGVQSVPFYLLNGRYHISGAQPPKVMLAAFAEAANETPQITESIGGACGIDLATGKRSC
jgi:predicted DsbA family dithiol-disulfide isomerase